MVSPSSSHWNGITATSTGANSDIALSMSTASDGTTNARAPAVDNPSVWVVLTRSHSASAPRGA